uniref:Uncharacterized protein n=1 Tax=Arundo donax TaxID=35708 RepID=A0A0A8ZFP3_ARUDO
MHLLVSQTVETVSIARL